MTETSEKILEELKISTIKQADEIAFENLLNKSFPVPAGSSFLDDFPIWKIKHGADIIRLGAHYNNELIGCAGLRIANLKAPNKNIRIGIIGGVAIDEKFRKKGLARLLVDKLTEAARIRKASMIILWGSEHQFYQKLGFELCGLQVRVPLQKLDLPKSKGIIRFGWRGAIFDALTKRQSGIAVEKKDISWFSDHKNVQWLSEETLSDHSSYVAFNRGIDLRGMVHEWGGDKDQVKNLLARVQEQIPNAELLGSPKQFKQLGFEFDSGQLEYLCMAKIIDPRDIFRSFDSQTAFSVQHENGSWTIDIEQKRISGLKDNDLTKLFFGPEKVLNEPVGNFPFPLWVWGLDAA